MKNNNNVSRRKFLNLAGCAGMGSLTFLNTLLNLKAVNAACSSAYNFNDYKALVCIMLPGGNDSFNMLMPTLQNTYNEYAATRANLAIPANEILSLNGNGSGYGVHPNMPEVQSLFNQNKLSFIANVGTLIEPGVTANNYESKLKPNHLFSHNDQIMQWHNAIYDKREIKGWGGRMADLIYEGNTNQNVSMNISLSGSNIFQSGESVVEMSTKRYRASTISRYENFQIRNNLINNMLEQTHTDIFKQTYNNTIKKSIEMAAELNEKVFDHYTENNWSCNTGVGYFGGNLEGVAKIISRQSLLGFNRQIFFVQADGSWDTHGAGTPGVNTHGILLEGLSKGLHSFYECLETIGKQNEVLTFTMSEFGRTLTSNSDGTDHGWGGNVMVMGGPNVINGGNIYGNYPSLALNAPQIINERAIAIPTTSTDEYFAEIARWFGLSYNDITDSVCPGLNNFYTPSAQLPIGFAQI